MAHGFDRGAAGREHRVQQDDLAIVERLRGFEVVGFGDQGVLVAGDADVGDRGLREQVEEAIEEAESGAQDGGEDDGARQIDAAGDFQWGLAAAEPGGEVGGDRGDHQRGDAPQPLAELGSGAMAVAQAGQLGVDQGVVDDVDHGSHESGSVHAFQSGIAGKPGDFGMAGRGRGGQDRER